jgi:hypothetical protein
LVQEQRTVNENIMEQETKDTTKKGAKKKGKKERCEKDINEQK